jgi:osmotically-inducible protein OsmY
VVVHDGWVTLEGEVEWNYQREEAKWSAYRVRGVLGVSNLIQLKTAVAAADIKNAILEIFARNALLDGKRWSATLAFGVAFSRSARGPSAMA